MSMSVGRTWKPVPGTHEEAWVATDGTVRGPHGDVQPVLNDHGALVVKVPGLRGRPRRLAQLVIETFAGRPAAGLWLIHLDHDRANCSLENLRWVSQSAYYEHQLAAGRKPWKQACRAGKERQEVLRLIRSPQLGLSTRPAAS